MERAYRQSTRVLGLLIMVLGLAVVISTVVRGGGITALGILVGVALVAFGGARAYLAGPAPESRSRR